MVNLQLLKRYVGVAIIGLLIGAGSAVLLKPLGQTENSDTGCSVEQQANVKTAP